MVEKQRLFHLHVFARHSEYLTLVRGRRVLSSYFIRICKQVSSNMYNNMPVRFLPKHKKHACKIMLYQWFQKMSHHSHMIIQVKLDRRE